tara:strand:+ start:22662 stop:25097 length:2436 start_codon:yes stop_codon:yes gene_type:complete
MSKELQNRKQVRNLVKEILGVESLITKETTEQTKQYKDLANLMGKTAQQAKVYTGVIDKLRDLKDEIKQIAEDEAIATDGEVQAQKKILDALNKQKDRQAEINGFFGSFKDKLDDAAAIMRDPKVATGLFAIAAADAMKDFGKAVLDTRKEMGLMAAEVFNVAGTLGMASIKGFTMGVGIGDAADAMKSLSAAGIQYSDITSDTVKEVAVLTTQLGVGSEQAAKLFKQFKMLESSSGESAKSVIEFTKGLARANGVAPGKVMNDIANNTEAFAAYSDDSGKNMIKAAVFAAQLGVEMSTLSGMADNLLNIEDSIQKEMEASVLLGRQINMNKARELALSGDLEGAAAAAIQQMGGIAEFQKMNVIERKAAAAAAGIQVSELQTILSNKSKQVQLGLTELTTAEKTHEVVAGIGKQIANNIPLLASGINMLGSLTNVLGRSEMKRYAKSAIFMAKEVGHAVTMGIFRKKSLAQSLGIDKFAANKGEDLVSSLKDKAKEKGGDLVDKGADKLKGAFEKTPKTGTPGKGFNVKSALKAAAAMLIIAAAMFVFAKAAQQFGVGINWPSVAIGSAILVSLGASAALLGKMSSQIIQGSLAMAILGLALVPAAFAFSLLAGVDAGSIIAMAGAIIILSAAALVIGSIMASGVGAIAFALGAAAIAGLGLAIIPFAGALGMLEGVDVTSIFGGIANLASSSSSIITLGLALSAMALGVATLAGSLMILTPMLPTLLALGTVGIAAGLISGQIGGNTGTEVNPPEEEAEQALTETTFKNAMGEVVTAISQMKVEMDGRSVGKILSLALPSSTTVGRGGV